MDWSSMTRRLFLLLTGGLLAKAGARSSANAAEAEALSASEILERMATAYATCATYRDAGRVTTIFVQSDGEYTDEKPFTTAFVRPDRFRFEYRSSFYDGVEQRYLIWNHGSDTRTWWDVQPGVDEKESLSSALSAATGVSGGSSHTVPTLLIEGRADGNRFAAMTDLRRLEDARSGEADCFRVQDATVPAKDPQDEEYVRRRFKETTGKDWVTPVSDPITIWIDKATFLIRRIEERIQFDTFRTESTTTYEPLIDVAIPDELLRFDPPAE